MNNSKVKKNFSTKISLKSFKGYEIIDLIEVFRDFDGVFECVDYDDLETYLIFSEDKNRSMCYREDPDIFLAKREAFCVQTWDWDTGRISLSFMFNDGFELQKVLKNGKTTLKFDRKEYSISLQSDDKINFFLILSEIIDSLNRDECRDEEFSVKVEYTKP